jgi:replicative DNA helicase
MTDEKENERLYLGSLLIATESGEANTRLKANDFSFPAYGRIYETILKQYREGIVPTIATLHSALPDIPASDIADLTNAISSAANIGYYETQIYKASKTKLFITALQTAKEEIDCGSETDTVIKNLLPALETVSAARNEAGIKTAAELLAAEFKPLRRIVPTLISEGLTMINGAPKIGKSWFVLNLAIATSMGNRFLGTLKSEKTETLYLALEDSERRLQERLEKLQAPTTLTNLKITTQWRDGYIGLESYLASHRTVGLVIIDTLVRFANIEDMNDYSITTKAMSRLKQIADTLNIAIVVIHHAKKMGKGSSGTDWMEATLGSTGLTGTTDSILYINRRSRSKPDAALYVTGRDTADIIYKIKLDFDVGSWVIDGPGIVYRKPGTGLDFDWSQFEAQMAVNRQAKPKKKSSKKMRDENEEE